MKIIYVVLLMCNSVLALAEVLVTLTVIDPSDHKVYFMKFEVANFDGNKISQWHLYDRDRYIAGFTPYVRFIYFDSIAAVIAYRLGRFEVEGYPIIFIQEHPEGEGEGERGCRCRRPHK